MADAARAERDKQVDAAFKTLERRVDEYTVPAEFRARLKAHATLLDTAALPERRALDILTNAMADVCRLLALKL